MIVLFAVFLLTLLVITAVAIVRTENLFVAVMLMAIFSLLMAANFFILDAADVALTEAAIGAGVTTVIFPECALSLTAEKRKKGRSVNRAWLPIAMFVVTVTTLVLNLCHIRQTANLATPKRPSTSTWHPGTCRENAGIDWNSQCGYG